jgi:hypothetical protein
MIIVPPVVSHEEYRLLFHVKLFPANNRHVKCFLALTRISYMHNSFYFFSFSANILAALGRENNNNNTHDRSRTPLASRRW